MIRTLLALFLLSIPLVASPQLRDEEAERRRVAELGIRKSTQWNHRFVNGRFNPTGHRAVETTFDRHGNPIEILNFRANGDTSSRVLYRYNAQNLRTEYMLFQRDEGPGLTLSFKQNISYNERGQRNMEVVFDGVSSYRVAYTYNPDGSPREIIRFGPGNRIEERWVYTIRGNTQEIRVFVPDGVLSHTLTRQHDARGNLLSETRTNPAGVETRRTVSTFDAQGRLVERADFNAGRLTRKLFYTYNPAGLLAQIVQENPDGRRFVQSSFVYDATGNVLEERWAEDEASGFSHKLSDFDKRGALEEQNAFYAPYNFKVLYRFTYELF